MRRLTAVALAVCLVSVATTATANWSVGSAPGGSGAAAASSVNQGATPTATATGPNVTVSWASSTLSNGQPVSGYTIRRYDAVTDATQTVLSGCSGTVTTTSCTESSVPGGSWRYTVTPVLAANWRGPESTKSTSISVDATAPTNSIELSSISGGAYRNANIVYYRGTDAGSFRLTNTVADAGSGPAGSTTAALGGTSTGWTHTPSNVTTPATGPYVSNLFSWGAGTASSPTEVVTGRDAAGNTAATTLSFINDSTAPTSGTITYADGNTVGRSVSIAFTTGTDTGSGISTRQLQRASALLSGTTCGTFGAFTNLGADAPSSPVVDTQLANSTCYKYQYVVADRVGNTSTATSTSVVKVDYATAVSATIGLLNFWRLGETGLNEVSWDTFTGTAGVTLQSRSGELGATWTKQPPSTADATLTNAGRLRKAETNTVGALYAASGVPPSANYAVAADVIFQSAVTNDAVGVVGRIDMASGTGTYYAARYERDPGAWVLYSVVNGNYTNLGQFAQALSAGNAYRLTLDMNGSTIRLLVDGVQRLTATNSAVTATGRGGVLLGILGAGSTTITDTTGMHLDNFGVTPLPRIRAADSKGTNTGDYINGPTLGVTGALGADVNTAARFDGVNDYVQVSGSTGIPSGAAARSVEMWFKTTSASRQVLFGYGTPATDQQFGLWINSGGTVMTAWGYGTGSDKQFTLSSAVNDGAWHHVVKTYNGTSITLYIDGVALPAQAATRNTVMDSHGFTIGAIVAPGDVNSGGFFNGTLDDISLYTTALDQSTITNHYRLGTAR